VVIVRLGRNITIPTINVYTVHGDLVFPFVDSPGCRGVTNFYFRQPTVNRDRCMGKVWSLLLTGILGLLSFGIKKISAGILGLEDYPNVRILSQKMKPERDYFKVI